MKKAIAAAAGAIGVGAIYSGPLVKTTFKKTS